MIQKEKFLLHTISEDETETRIFACDVLSQPCYRDLLRDIDPNIHLKTTRSLPIAEESDIVVLTGPLNLEYYTWLREIGFSTKHIVSYNCKSAAVPLTDLIIKDPQALLTAIADTGKKPVFVPFYSGNAEEKAARLIKADLFGSPEELSLKYFNKDTFKKECLALGIPVVSGESRDTSGLNSLELADIVHGLLQSYPAVLIRGSLGAAGSSAYKVQNTDVEQILKNIKDSNDEHLLIEPFLQVVASPNDQWSIDRNGNVHYLGCSAQLFAGLHHIGNLYGQYFSERISNYIQSTSLKIVQNMATHGYRGVLGIDYIVTAQGIFPIENNARLNGSSFTMAIIDNIERVTGKRPACWKFFKAQTDLSSFNDLRKKLAPILYDGTSINAVFPYDCDTIPINGVFAPVLIAEDMYHIEYLAQALEELGMRRI